MQFQPKSHQAFSEHHVQSKTKILPFEDKPFFFFFKAIERIKPSEDSESAKWILAASKISVAYSAATRV